jgi:hypothetical protein
MADVSAWAAPRVRGKLIFRTGLRHISCGWPDAGGVQGAAEAAQRVQAHIGPFEYSLQGSLAYIGSEKAITNISRLSDSLATGGTLTYLFWHSACLSMMWSGGFLLWGVSSMVGNRILVLVGWSRPRCSAGMFRASSNRDQTSSRKEIPTLPVCFRNDGCIFSVVF